MSVQGLCQICESRQATEQCQRCGAMVCTVHYDRELGFCANCAAEVGGRDRPDRDDIVR